MSPLRTTSVSSGLSSRMMVPDTGELLSSSKFNFLVILLRFATGGGFFFVGTSGVLAARLFSGLGVHGGVIGGWFFKLRSRGLAVNSSGSEHLRYCWRWIAVADNHCGSKPSRCNTGWW